MSQNKAAADLVFSKHPAAEDQTQGLTSALVWWLTHLQLRLVADPLDG